MYLIVSHPRARFRDRKAASNLLIYCWAHLEPHRTEPVYKYVPLYCAALQKQPSSVTTACSRTWIRPEMTGIAANRTKPKNYDNQMAQPLIYWSCMTLDRSSGTVTSGRLPYDNGAKPIRGGYLRAPRIDHRCKTLCVTLVRRNPLCFQPFRG